MAISPRERNSWIDVTTEAGALFGCKFDRKDKELLLDIAIVRLCVSSNLNDVARHAGKYLVNAIEWKINKEWGSFLPIYSIFLFAMMTRGDAGQDDNVPIPTETLAIR